MFEWIFYPWMISNAYTLYARIDLTPIYSMLVLFTCCWGSDSSIQAEVGKLNGDLLQPSGIRYIEVWSFSVRYLISFAYWKGLISWFKLSIVVPQALGISLHNTSIIYIYSFLTILLFGHIWVNRMVVFVTSTSYFVPCFVSMMGETSWPSFNKSILVDVNTSSKN